MLKIFTCFSSKNHFILLKQNNFFSPLFKALNKRFNKHIIFNFCSITPPKGCGKETCGCAGATQESDLEKKLKSINYKILQCINLGHFEEGIELSDQYIAEVEQSFGKEHPFYCSAINNKAFILKTCGEYEEAKLLYEEASETYKKLYSEKSEKYIITMQNLATVHRELKNPSKSLEIYEKITTIIDSNPDIVQPNILANIYLTAAGNFRVLKSFEECDNLLSKALKIITEKYNDRNLPLATIYNNMGLSYKDQGLYDKALTNYKIALEIREGFLDQSHPDVIAVRHNIGQLYFDKGDKEEAMKYFSNNLEFLKRKEGIQEENNN